jgi:protein-L-isoaspartate(D-aspartate) O-methyltransferase
MDFADQHWVAAATLMVAVFLTSAALGCSGADEKKTLGHFAAERQLMVRRQLEDRGIRDEHVLKAMLKVERHKFVPDKQQRYAYSDSPLPIGEGQTISQPYVVALMTELLDLEGQEKVLEVGTGSGYQAAILGELAREVYSIEIVKPLADRADSLLKELGYTNVTVRCGDGYAGWPEKALFDAIIVTCAPPEVPEPLTDQLAEGGRLVVPVGVGSQDLLLIQKQDGTLKTTNIAPVLFVPMTGQGVENKK